MLDPESQFREALRIFEAETDMAVQTFYAWQTINAIAATDRAVLRGLNSTPYFWNTTTTSLLVSTFVTLGRIFDPDQKNHSVSRLLAIGHKSPEIFSLSALAARKRAETEDADDWLSDYLAHAYVPTNEDFRRLKRYVQQRRAIYESSYRPIRHRVFAHREVATPRTIHELLKATNIGELQALLVFLRRLHNALWQLLVNGHKPVLRPARYSVPRIRSRPSPAHKAKQLQERVVHDTEALLQKVRDA